MDEWLNLRFGTWLPEILKLVRGRGRQVNSKAHAFPHQLMTLCQSLLQELREGLY